MDLLPSLAKKVQTLLKLLENCPKIDGDTLEDKIAKICAKDDPIVSGEIEEIPPPAFDVEEERDASLSGTLENPDSEPDYLIQRKYPSTRPAIKKEQFIPGLSFSSQPKEFKSEFRSGMAQDYRIREEEREPKTEDRSEDLRVPGGNSELPREPPRLSSSQSYTPMIAGRDRLGDQITVETFRTRNFDTQRRDWRGNRNLPYKHGYNRGGHGGRGGRYFDRLFNQPDWKERQRQLMKSDEERERAIFED